MATPVVITSSMWKTTNLNFIHKLQRYQRIRFPNDPNSIDWFFLILKKNKYFSRLLRHVFPCTSILINNSYVNVDLASCKHIHRSINEWILVPKYKSNASECIRYVRLLERRWKTWISLCLQTDGKRNALSENSSDCSDDDTILRRRKKRKSKRSKNVCGDRHNDKEDGELSSQSDESVIVVEEFVTETRYEG